MPQIPDLTDQLTQLVSTTQYKSKATRDISIPMRLFLSRLRQGKINWKDKYDMHMLKHSINLGLVDENYNIIEGEL